ncbi:NnrS family protein [Azospirillum sp. RWY-5-1]|uniref:NnrS family protein n=1 Tax=Azospirillum oleiclasticum TaxID=2735135 RepID=A0ABX2TCE0_9PROT|nr:NnrS family protein [Azospirillum oleiclasticum]NYZ15734.1 NnrS family protein [Azospirillum oleiclasticum]NYZ22004.1 NnrS family protein [Azospirillum oleiclasticum]
MTTRTLSSSGWLGTPMLLGYGFRPFFLLAGLSAPALVLVWLAVLATGGWPDTAVPALSWHGHEMLFGFVMAAVAGFLLTAVPSWTGSPALKGAGLGALVALWLAGRVVVAPWSGVPPAVAAVIDLAFLPALGVALALPLVRAGKIANTAFLVLLGLLTAANLLFHLEWLGRLADGARLGLALGIGVVLMMVTVIGGRILPAFTRNALKARGVTAEVTTRRCVERLTLLSTVAMIPVDLILPGSLLAGAVALVAAVAHARRLAGWQTRHTLGQPILWILHAGYAWVPLALALKAAHGLAGLVDATAWLHALTAGGFATLILAVMSRAALGHTGRPVVATRVTVASYALLLLAATLRTLAPELPGGAYTPALHAAGLAWVASFAAFLWVYAPILTRPRADGQPG